MKMSGLPSPFASGITATSYVSKLLIELVRMSELILNGCYIILRYSSSNVADMLELIINCPSSTPSEALLT